MAVRPALSNECTAHEDSRQGKEREPWRETGREKSNPLTEEVSGKGRHPLRGKISSPQFQSIIGPDFEGLCLRLIFGIILVLVNLRGLRGGVLFQVTWEVPLYWSQLKLSEMFRGQWDRDLSPLSIHLRQARKQTRPWQFPRKKGLGTINKRRPRFLFARPWLSLLVPWILSGTLGSCFSSLLHRHSPAFGN
jgi:hypothetical protein